MQYRKLGNTSLDLSFISFGASSLGGVFHPIDERKAEKAVETAIEMGVNFIDVSPYYGHYKAETVLGRVLRRIPRNEYYLSTKVGRYGENGVNTWDYSRKRVIESVHESMERLGIDYIDLLHAHDIEFCDPEQLIHETLPTLNEIRATGLVGFIGITGLPLTSITNIIDRVPQGMVDAVLSFCHYTLQDQTLLALLPYFKEKNIGVINASPLSMGLLSSRGAPGWHPASTQLKELCQKAAKHCESKGYPIEKLALSYCLQQTDIVTTLVGTSDAGNMKKNILWSLEEPDPTLLLEVQEILQPVMNETWHNS